MNPVFISLTRLRIRSIRYLIPFLWEVILTARQAQQSGGFLGGRILWESRMTFWTLTAWEGVEAMRAYQINSAHLAAMPKLLVWCDEASVVHWHQSSPDLPGWKEAHRHMMKDGRLSKVNNPAPALDISKIVQPQPSRFEIPLRSRVTSGRTHAEHLKDAPGRMP